MAWRHKRTVDTTISLPTGVLPSYARISSMVKRIINASQYDYHESEAFEVQDVIKATTRGADRFEGGAYGAVRGTFINNPHQEILGEVVLPLMPNITNIPLVGEHVVVTEYNGQHYYTSIINRKNSPNENAISGASGIYEKNTKFGETFEKSKKISRITVNEGDIVYEGRFGNSIKLGSNPKNQSPNIRIRAGQDKQFDDVNLLAKENINKDGSSIYLSTDETISIYNPNFPTKTVNGNSIVINSDKLFFNGRKGNVDIRASKDIYIEADEIFINAKKGGTIKMGDPRAPMIPTVNGQKLLEFQAAVLGVLSGIQKIFVNVGLGPSALPKVVLDTVKLLKDVDVVAEGVTKQTFLHKEVLIADPDFKIPKVPKFPKIPKIPKDMGIPKVPSIRIPKELDITKLKQ